MAEILEKYQLKEEDTILTEPNFPYLHLWKAIRKDSNKEIRDNAELALEMRLLRFELTEVPTNSKRLEELRSSLCDISREFLYHEQHYSYRLAA